MDRRYIDDHQDHRRRTSSSSSAQVRPYVCDFCRRGFASAQALGGHMNIHRKDRAKLRQSICDDENEISLSLDINNITDTDLQAKDHHQHQRRMSNNEDFLQFGDISSRNHPEGSERPIELSFFANITSGKDDMSGQMKEDDEEKKVRLAMEGSSSSQTEVVDLELRLGLDPSSSSKSNTQR